MAKHLIDRLEYQIRTRKKSDAHKIQDEISMLSHGDLLNELDKLLDKYAGDDEHIFN